MQHILVSLSRMWELCCFSKPPVNVSFDGDYHHQKLCLLGACRNITLPIGFSGLPRYVTLILDIIFIIISFLLKFVIITIITTAFKLILRLIIFSGISNLGAGTSKLPKVTKDFYLALQQ